MAPSPIESLTETQRKCLHLVGRGRQTKEIALALGLAPNTVDTYLRQALRTLGVATRFEAARLLERQDSDPSQDLRYQPQALVEAPDSAIPKPPGSDAGPVRPTVVQERHPPFDPKGLPHRKGWWRRKPGPWGGRNDLTIKQRLLWMAIGTVLVLMMLFLGLAAVESFQTTLLTLHGKH